MYPLEFPDECPHALNYMVSACRHRGRN